MDTNEKFGQDTNQIDENCLGRGNWFNACCYSLYFTGNVQIIGSPPIHGPES